MEGEQKVLERGERRDRRRRRGMDDRRTSRRR